MASAKAAPGTAVARRADSQLSAVEQRQKDQRDALRGALARYAPSFAKVLPMHLTPERMVTLALVAATKTPQLFECSPESIALAVMEVSRWGLDIGRTAHLVPFRTKVPGTQNQYTTVCTPIADWKGLVELMLRTGHVRDVKARCVYAKEHFHLTEGTEARLEHAPSFNEQTRGELIAAYAIAWLRGGITTFEVLSKDEIDSIRANAPSKDSPAWKGHYAEMAKKTAVRRLAKRMPQTAQLRGALDMEIGAAGDLSPAAARMVEIQRRFEQEEQDRRRRPKLLAGAGLEGYEDQDVGKADIAVTGSAALPETEEARLLRLDDERLAREEAEPGRRSTP